MLIEKVRRSKACQCILAMSIVAFLLIALYSFVKAAFTGDIEVFIAAANQVKYKEESGLKAIFEAWELKGIANRLFMYLLYKVGILFAPYGKVTVIEPIIKSVYSCIMIIFISGTSLLISKEKITRLIVFVTEYIMVFCTYTAAQLQAEMTVVVISVFCFSLLVHGGRKCCILAGMLGAGFFFFKSVFILLFFVVLLGASLYSDWTKDKKFYVQCIGSFALSEALMFFLIKLYYPQEFADMSAAKDFQTTIFSEGSNIGLWDMLNRFFSGFTTASVAFPFLLVGIVSSVLMTVILLREKKWGTFIGNLVIWLLVVDIIIASNKYFLYHYYLLTLPSTISFMFLLKRWKFDKELLFPAGICSVLLVAVCWRLKDGLKQTPFINYSTMLLIIIHILVVTIAIAMLRNNWIKNIGTILILTACSFFYLNYSSFVAPKWRNEQMLLRQSEIACAGIFPEDFGDEPVLFLDGGAVPFYVDAPSYSRYFFNLPMQRWKAGNDWDIQKSEYERLMNYSGKYIIYTKWFGLEKYPDLQTKIENEYEHIPGSSIYTFSPDWNLFNLSNSTDVEALRNADDCFILIRK